MKAFFFDCGTRDPLASASLFLLRTGFGAMMMIGHGIPKLRNFSGLKDQWYVPDFIPLRWMSPPVSLVSTILAELAVPVFLMLGLATRPAAFVLGFAMVVAAFDVHHGDPWFFSPGATKVKELALLYLMPMLVLIVSGAGAWSLDAGLHQEKRRRHW